MQETISLTGAVIREKFLSYFETQLGHKRLPSASLIPANNPTVLLTPAGMLPFVPIFLGIEPPPSPPRVVTVQKCARVSGKASDLEAVGRTPRHHTFFEMLGNFSFGDYFKSEVIPWAWKFVTDELGLPPEKLIVSVYKTDDEAFGIWRDQVGIPEPRIYRMDADNNFWGPPGPTGPCGPCSEIYYDLDNGLGFDDRFLEIWNLVFMELFKDAEGEFHPLEKKNVDTGMGLERITTLIQGKSNTFETDLLFPLVQAVSKRSSVAYHKSPETDVALKIVSDHIRCLSFAIGDGATPSNEGRGYIIRMILRRAARYGRKYLGLDRPFLAPLVQTVVDGYGHAYPDLKAKQTQIEEAIAREEERFLETLDRGSSYLEEMIEKTQQAKKTVVPGTEIFKLYDTFGFPVELTTDIAQEHGLTLDIDGFEAAMAEQRERARAARKSEGIVDDQVYAKVFESLGATPFVGYDQLTAEVKVRALLVEGESVQSVSGTNTPFEMILDQTPFYAESGGQVGDRGTCFDESGQHGLTVVVKDTVKVGDMVVHRCVFDQGSALTVGQALTAEVEPTARRMAALHHTGTHLLNAALRKVLGPEVNQAGSSVGPDGARFDFTLNRGMTPGEIQRVEVWMNKWITEDLPRTVEMLPLDEAKASGAIAMFDEKYGDTVRVVSYGEVSRELCGGTHVGRLGQIGFLKIVGEGAIASGVRRIEMVAGDLAVKHVLQQEDVLSQTAKLLKVPPMEVLERVQRVLEEQRAQEKRMSQLLDQMAATEAKRLVDQGPTVANTPFIAYSLEGYTGDTLKRLAEAMVSQLAAPYGVILASVEGDKVSFVAAVSDDLVKKGFKAGDWVKALATPCGGGGGGRPQFAQAGGKDPSPLPQAMATLIQQIGEQWSAL